MNRFRTKECKKCQNLKEVLYRCRFEKMKTWIFVCGICLKEIKTLFKDTHQYVGTWKSKKK